MRTTLVRLLMWLGCILASLFSLFILSQIILRIGHRRNPSPMSPRWSAILYASKRSKYFGTPEKIVDRAGVTPGMRVLEVGPGPGNFTLALARRVAEQGKKGSVTCLEIQQEMIDMLRRRLNPLQVKNVEIMQGDAQQIPFAKESFDLVFLATVIGEVPDVRAMFRECERVLKPGGILAVTEQITDPDFRLPGYSHKLAHMTGLQLVSCEGLPWWIYTARYQKPVGKQTAA
jgi:2-polyprenyl-3-methyl-5-hydroxy-6-metoxy-1,4-benzoquinol methylase